MEYHYVWSGVGRLSRHYLRLWEEGLVYYRSLEALLLGNVDGSDRSKLCNRPEKEKKCLLHPPLVGVGEADSL